jgi:hypothetical protein
MVRERKAWRRSYIYNQDGDSLRQFFSTVWPPVKFYRTGRLALVVLCRFDEFQFYLFNKFPFGLMPNGRSF